MEKISCICYDACVELTLGVRATDMCADNCAGNTNAAYHHGRCHRDAGAKCDADGKANRFVA